MNNKLIQRLAGAALLLSVNAAQAAISCNISSPGFIDGYNNTILSSVQTSYSITCTRGVDATDPTTTTYAVKVNNGLNPAGATNQAITPEVISEVSKKESKRKCSWLTLINVILF